MAVACQVAHRLELLAMLPSQVKLRPSNWASPSSGSIGSAAPDGSDHAAVLGGDVVQIHRGLEAARARHVLRNDGRIARDVLSDETGKQARVDVVAAADAVADDERNGTAAVEILDPGGARAAGQRQRDGERGQDRPRKRCGIMAAPS